MSLEVWIFTPLLFASGYLLGRWHNQRWRYDRVAAFRRRLQLITSRIENKGMRRNGKRPSLKPWQKWFLGLLHWCSPTLTRYTLFRPETLIGWFNRYVRCYWWLISSAGKRKLPGRPRIPESEDFPEEPPGCDAQSGGGCATRGCAGVKPFCVLRQGVP
jgi:hypothetical protein